MNTVRKTKVQEIKIPKVEVIRRYDNFKDVKKEKKATKHNVKVIGVNRMRVLKAAVYITVFLFVAMSQMFVTYSVSRLIVKKNEMEKEVKKIKAQLETAETNLITNYDLKNVEKRSIEMGFINNDNSEYIKIENK